MSDELERQLAELKKEKTKLTAEKELKEKIAKTKAEVNELKSPLKRKLKGLLNTIVDR